MMKAVKGSYRELSALDKYSAIDGISFSLLMVIKEDPVFTSSTEFICLAAYCVI